MNTAILNSGIDCLPSTVEESERDKIQRKGGYSHVENQRPGAKVLVAHVTLDGETMTVLPSGVAGALDDMAGKPTAGMCVVASIVYAEMDRAEFEALPELF